jgi:hypothetical protein
MTVFYYRPCHKAFATTSEYELYSRLTDDHFKQDALQQVRILCDCPLGLTLATVQHDFSLEREWNQSLPDDTKLLFQYIHDNAEVLLDALCDFDLFKRIACENLPTL